LMWRRIGPASSRPGPSRVATLSKFQQVFIYLDSDWGVWGMVANRWDIRFFPVQRRLVRPAGQETGRLPGVAQGDVRDHERARAGLSQ
jgi:hypothetical protein